MADCQTAPAEWADYLLRLKALPSVKILITENGCSMPLYWDNLYDYYAEQLQVNSTVESLSKLDYNNARFILVEFAKRLDAEIAKQTSFWNFRKDPDELNLLQTLRTAL